MKTFGKIFVVLAVVMNFSGVVALADDLPCEASATNKTSGKTDEKKGDDKGTGSSSSSADATKGSDKK